MNVDIRSTIFVISIMAAIAAIWLAFRARNAFRIGNKLPFFFKKRQQYELGARLLLAVLLLLAFAYANLRWGEGFAYRYFPPTLTPSLTPTITLTPTVTLTPTITLTPTLTSTPSVTGTPFIPEQIATVFESMVTQKSDFSFSLIRFSTEIDEDLQAVEPAIEFENPLETIYGTYSYNMMDSGVQWTEIWVREGEIIHYNSGTWQGGSGGYGAALLKLPPDEWLPGSYQLQFFIGENWITSGHFRVLGNPPTSTPTLTPTPSRTPTFTPSPTSTPTPTRTPLLTATPSQTATTRPSTTP